MTWAKEQSEVKRLRQEIGDLRKAILSLEAFVRVPTPPPSEPDIKLEVVLQAIARTQEEVKELRVQLFSVSKVLVKTMIGHIDPTQREIEQIKKDTHSYVKSPYIKSREEEV